MSQVTRDLKATGKFNIHFGIIFIWFSDQPYSALKAGQYELKRNSYYDKVTFDKPDGKALTNQQYQRYQSTFDNTMSETVKRGDYSVPAKS